MESLAHELPDKYHAFAKAQDRIGWRRFLEGMVVRELFALVQVDTFQEGSTIAAEKWVKQLIQKLLELTHGMWIYRNLTIHDTAQGVLAVQRKEELQATIEMQIAQGRALTPRPDWYHCRGLLDCASFLHQLQYMVKK